MAKWRRSSKGVPTLQAHARRPADFPRFRPRLRGCRRVVPHCAAMTDMDERNRRLHQFFLISLLLKGANALIECAAGIALELVSTSSTVNFINELARAELIENPKDFIATHLMTWAQSFSVQAQHFYAFYLLSHGIVKLLLVIALLRG